MYQLLFAPDSLDKTTQHALILLSISGPHLTYFSSCTVVSASVPAMWPSMCCNKALFPHVAFTFICVLMGLLWARNYVNILLVLNTTLLCAVHTAGCVHTRAAYTCREPAILYQACCIASSELSSDLEPYSTWKFAL